MLQFYQRKKFQIIQNLKKCYIPEIFIIYLEFKSIFQKLTTEFYFQYDQHAIMKLIFYKNLFNLKFHFQSIMVNDLIKKN